MTSTGMMILPFLSFAEKAEQELTGDELEEGFSRPPASARPLAFWMWMNGHITREGISRDIDAMKQMGLAGVFIYNAGMGVAKGPVAYGSALWDEMVVHAMQEAQKAGLQLFLHNSPGYSSSGGRGVTPAMGMQQLVWSVVHVESKDGVDVILPQPFTKLGYYRDAFVVAFPATAERRLMRDLLQRVRINGKEIDKSVLLQANTGGGLELRPESDGKAVVQLEFAEPFTARSIAVTRLSEPSVSVYDAAFDHPPAMVLQRSDDGVSFTDVCPVSMPFLRSVDAPGIQTFPAVKSRYFRLIANKKTTLTGVELFEGPRLADWAGKVNFTDREQAEKPEPIDQQFVIDPATVVDLTSHLQSGGRLLAKLPAGNWTILRMGHTCTGTRTVATPDDAGGLEIDKFSKEAVDAYFELQLDSLFSRLKRFAGNTFKGVLIDSYEVGKQNWTSRFPEAFAQKRGYLLVGWLPALTGRVVQSIESTEKVLWDVRRTHADLIAENYYGRFRERCASAGLQFLAQPNGDGVFDSLQVGRNLDVPMAEFWASYLPGTINLCKQAVSIAHGYGKKIVAAEAYTGLPFTTKWTAYPFALKSQGDHIYSLGINRFVFHVIVHQPYTTGLPGMTMGPFGTHFDRNNTWCRQSGTWIDCLARSQFLLQQGRPVADILYFKGEDPASGIPDVNYVDPPVPRTLNGDVIGPDVLLHDTKMSGTTIMLAGGMQYRLLILAPLKKLSVPVLQKLQELVAQGMILLVTARPTDMPGRANERETEARKLAGELWGDLDGQAIKERSYGKGKIYWNKPLAAILEEQGILPDFEFTSARNDAAVHFTHRVMGETEIYFISNHLRRREAIVCRFRVAGKQPETWDPQTGEVNMPVVYDTENGRTSLPVVLDHAGSLFVIFRKKIAWRSYTAIDQNGASLLSAKAFPPVVQTPFPDVTNNFTILFWVKPDTASVHPKGLLIFPPEGETVYGTGHAACGMAAGQNGIRIFEREKGPNHGAREMIKTVQPLEGWTHLALRYKDGQPSLYINGRLAASAAASGKIVHPGLGTPPTDEAFSAFFEGNFTMPQLVREALGEAAIYQQFHAGLPPTELPYPVRVNRQQPGELVMQAWQNGFYELQGDGAKKAIQVTGCRVVPLRNSWQVQFPAGTGAPSFIQLTELQSLHLHPEFGVRHFSGTATYRAVFQWEKNKTFPGQRVLLDLGRVEVVAEVALNGKAAGLLWKEPFFAEVTNLLRPGSNVLTVRVTNLWPNRMIGDAYLPEENTYNENGFVTQFPDWFLHNKAKPGQRITFSAWKALEKTNPLLTSGLLGPVRLIVGRQMTIRE